MCTLVRSGESSEKIQWRKSRQILSRLWLSWFFRPWVTHDIIIYKGKLSKCSFTQLAPTLKWWKHCSAFTYPLFEVQLSALAAGVWPFFKVQETRGAAGISFDWESDSVKRHLRGRHLSALNLKFDFISDGGCTREEQIALSLKRHLFLHGGREPKAFWICFSRVHPPSEIKSNFKFKTLKRHLLKRHLTLSERANWLTGRSCRCCQPLVQSWQPCVGTYRSIQNHYRQRSVPRAINSKCRYRSALPEGSNFITETDVWECWQHMSHYSYRFFFEFQSISIADPDFGLETNYHCHHKHYRPEKNLSELFPAILDRIITG